MMFPGSLAGKVTVPAPPSEVYRVRKSPAPPTIRLAALRKPFPPVVWLSWMVGVIHPRSPWVEMMASPGCRVASSTGSTVPLTTKSTIEPPPHGAGRATAPSAARLPTGAGQVLDPRRSTPPALRITWLRPAPDWSRTGTVAPDMTARQIEGDHATLVDVLRAAGRVNGDAEAYVEPATDTRSRTVVTFGEWDRAAD